MTSRISCTSARPDPRQVRTRAALLEAAIELVDEFETTQITVTDLANRAGVTRMTLYQHFADRDELLQAAGATRYERALAEHPRAGQLGIAGSAEVLFEHVCAHADFYRRLLNGTCGLGTYRALQRFLGEGITRAASATGSDLDDGAQLFLSGGAMSYLLWWLDAGARSGYTARDAARRVEQLLTAHFAIASPRKALRPK